MPRPQGAACDIGAYEFEAPTPTPTPTGTSTLTPDAYCDLHRHAYCDPSHATATPPDRDRQPRLLPRRRKASRRSKPTIRDYVAQGEIAPMAEKSLVSKLDAALKSLSKGNTRAAARQLGAFIQLLEAQQGKRIAEAAADDLIAQAKAVIGQIERTSSGR